MKGKNGTTGHGPDPKQKDKGGAKRINFGEGKHDGFPMASGGKVRADAVHCYSEFTKFNSGAEAPASQTDRMRAGKLAMKISAKEAP